MKYLVTGGSGQLGRDVIKELEKRGAEFFAPDRTAMSLADGAAIAKTVGDYRPDVVIHCGAYTAVDRAESERAECWAANAAGTAALARTCRQIGATMLYISTDYVFPGAGDAAYRPDDAKGPLNAYGASKLAGEFALAAALENFFIVRISWVFSATGNNFIKTMLRLADDRDQLNVVADQIGSPTYTADLAPRLLDLLATKRYGVYHMTNEGYCSWAELAREIFRAAGKNVAVAAISTADYPTAARRPLNSRLDKTALDEAGIARLPHWRDAVKRCLAELGALSGC